MSQNDFVIANQTAPAFRADLNSALQALASVSSGSTEPATKYANMLWYDTGTNTLKKRNEANSAWLIMGTFDEGVGTFTPTGSPPTQDQTTWNTGTSTTESVISPAKLKGAIETLAPATDVATTIAGLSAGSIGTYVFAYSTTASDVNFGSTSAGSALVPTSAARSVDASTGIGGTTFAVASALSGTWRCMGRYDHAAGGTQSTIILLGATLWLRIS